MRNRSESKLFRGSLEEIQNGKNKITFRSRRIIAKMDLNIINTFHYSL